MPRQNRVDPAGRLHAVAERGLLMGNRGCLHDANGRVVRRKPPTDRWISCVTEFKDRKRPLMRPGHYTELFFLDEATALAAGHRPCFECRREAAVRFSRAMARSRGAEQFSAVEMDAILKPERDRGIAGPDRLVSRDRLHALPDGAFVSDGARFYLVRNATLLRWDFGGYRRLDIREAESKQPLWLTTTPSIIDTLRQGYRPMLHPSADAAKPA